MSVVLSSCVAGEEGKNFLKMHLVIQNLVITRCIFKINYKLAEVLCFPGGRFCCCWHPLI